MGGEAKRRTYSTQRTDGSTWERKTVRAGELWLQATNAREGSSVNPKGQGASGLDDWWFAASVVQISEWAWRLQDIERANWKREAQFEIWIREVSLSASCSVRVISFSFRREAVADLTERDELLESLTQQTEELRRERSGRPRHGSMSDRVCFDISHSHFRLPFLRSSTWKKKSNASVTRIRIWGLKMTNWELRWCTISLMLVRLFLLMDLLWQPNWVPWTQMRSASKLKKRTPRLLFFCSFFVSLSSHLVSLSFHAFYGGNSFCLWLVSKKSVVLRQQIQLQTF